MPKNILCMGLFFRKAAVRRAALRWSGAEGAKAQMQPAGADDVVGTRPALIAAAQCLDLLRRPWVSGLPGGLRPPGALANEHDVVFALPTFSP